MKTPRIANAIGQIDDDLVAGAAKCKTKNKKHWLKWGSLAACFAVLVIAGAAILPSLFRENVTPEGTDSRYKDFSNQASESAIVWPWEYQTIDARVQQGVESKRLCRRKFRSISGAYECH